MTIQKSAYKLCKAIISTSARDELKSLLHGLLYTPAEPPLGWTDRSQLGYRGRKQYAQLLGYLLVNQERDKSLNSPIPTLFPPLTEPERVLLLSAHLQIVAMNAHCVKPLTKVLPNCAAALNPYSRMFTLQAPLVSAFPWKDDIFTQIVEAFSHHPAIVTAAQAPLPLVGHLPEAKVHEGVCLQDLSLRRAGVFSAPEDLQQFAMTEPFDSPARYAMRHFMALVSIRESLKNLNQMLYQALLTEHIPVLSEDNIIDMPRVSGNGKEIVFQPSGPDLMLDAWDIILVKKISEQIMNDDELCAVDHSRFDLSRDYGTSVTVKVRVLDENLNAFGYLLERL